LEEERMKKLLSLLLFSMSWPLTAEIWQEPSYTPDENHLPQEERQLQEEDSVIKKQRPLPALPKSNKSNEREEEVKKSYEDH
jgi:hypothetical protein